MGSTTQSTANLVPGLKDSRNATRLLSSASVLYILRLMPATNGRH
jgi:hypothetical protein